MNLPLGVAAARLVALPVALVALRTVEDYFIICTMGMGVLLFSVMNNWTELARGPLGIPGFPRERGPTIEYFGRCPPKKQATLALSVITQTIDVELEETRTEAGFPPLVTSRILRYDRFHHLVVRANHGIDILSR